MESYIFQVILFQLAFLLVYEFLLKRETFFNYNRAYLLITPVLAFLLPIINIEMLSSIVPQESVSSISRFWLPEVYVGDAAQNIKQLPALVLSEKSSSFNWLAIIYGIGAVGSIGILGKKLFNLFQLFGYNVISEVKSYKIIEIPSSNIACTFNKTIFLGADLSKDERVQIIAHELIHIEQKHSYDLVFFEIFKILFWFNPLIYIYQNRIAALHEFIADSKVVKTIEKRSYYEQLLNTAFNTQNISFINQFFNHSLIKKRIVMLQKSQSKTIAKFKYLILLPLISLMLTYVSCGVKTSAKNEPVSEPVKAPVVAQTMEDWQGDALENVPFAVVDQIPIFPGCENVDGEGSMKDCVSQKIQEHVQKNFNTNLGKELGFYGVNRVIVQFKIDKNGEITAVRARAPHPELETEAIRVINTLPKMIPGKQKGKAVAVMYSLPIVFQVEKVKEVDEKN